MGHKGGQQFVLWYAKRYLSGYEATSSCEEIKPVSLSIDCRGPLSRYAYLKALVSQSVENSIK